MLFMIPSGDMAAGLKRSSHAAALFSCVPQSPQTCTPPPPHMFPDLHGNSESWLRRNQSPPLFFRYLDIST